MAIGWGKEVVGEIPLLIAVRIVMELEKGEGDENGCEQMYSAVMGYCWEVEGGHGSEVLHSVEMEMVPDWEEAGV